MIPDSLAGGFGDFRRPSAVVGADWCVDDVAQALANHPDQALVLIRRWHATEGVLWYVRRRDLLIKLLDRLDAKTARALLEIFPEGVPLQAALALREEDSEDSLDLQEGQPALDFAGVVTHDDDAIIVLGSSAAMAERSAGHEAVEPAPEESAGPIVAYGRLEAPAQVEVGQEFPLTVGLSKTQQPGVASTEISLPPGTTTVEVLVVADGFTKQDEEQWRRELTVTAQGRLPAFTIRLTAREAGAKDIAATFAVAGRAIGYAKRLIMVGPDTPGRVELDAEPARIGLKAPGQTPDLTVEVLRQGQNLMWSFRSPHAKLKRLIPEEAVKVPLPEDPHAFTLGLLKLIPSTKSEDIADTMRGLGSAVLNKTPHELWKLLAELDKKQDDVPTLLFLTDDAHIPWELTLIGKPRDDQAPPFLAAQYDVGRWVLAMHRPKNPPPPKCDEGRMVVFWGAYDHPKWRPLPEAESETADLEGLYGATRMVASEEAVKGQLREYPTPAAIHFAGHGQYGGGGAEGGLILGDGQVLRPSWVRGQRFDRTPFVFLNACEAGASDSTLSVFAGMPQVFLEAGAGAVVAPLWKVKDKIAKKVALAFYSNVQSGLTAGAALRKTRLSFTDESTYLAYQLFGDPSLTLSPKAS